MISLFPELCKPAFVADGAITSQRVTDMLKPHLPDKREDMNDDERRVWQFGSIWLILSVRPMKTVGNFMFDHS